ncbi:OB-fold domain-containing protein [Nocardia coffeae]|uniref:OB-fold domain-containing protein n=1 Tax=Nocardia coffeae TaxID=2873381 RepID=UPI001F1CFB18|nr:OB-fold domain-containing protein [Nocardia coffeae]
MSGSGTVASWTVTHRRFLPQFETPYTVLLVRLAEADNILVPGGWAGDPDGTGLHIGLTVHVQYVEMPDESGEPAITLLQWASQDLN